MTEWPGHIGGNFVVAKITGLTAKTLKLPVGVHSQVEEFFVIDIGDESRQQRDRQRYGVFDQALKVYEYTTLEEMRYYTENQMLSDGILRKGKIQPSGCYTAKGGTGTEVWLVNTGMPEGRLKRPLGLKEAEVYIRHLVGSMAREFSTRQSTKGTSDMAVRVRGEEYFITGDSAMEFALDMPSDIPDLPIMVTVTLIPEGRCNIRWNLLCAIAGMTVVIDGIHYAFNGEPQYKDIVRDLYCGATLAKKIAINEQHHQVVAACIMHVEEAKGSVKFLDDLINYYGVIWGIRNGRTNIIESEEKFRLQQSKLRQAILDGKIPG